MTDAKIIDLEALRTRFDGDWEFYDELVEILKKGWPTDRVSIQESARKGDFGACKNMAHKIKGALGNLGAMKAHELAAQLEAAAKINSQAQISEKFPIFEREVEAFLKEYEASKSKR